MDFRTQSALLAAIVGLALGLSMLLRSVRPRRLTLYSLFALTIGAFYLTQFLNHLFWGSTGYPWVVRVILGANIIVGAAVPSTALAFFLEFLEVSPRAVRRGRRLAWASPVFGIAVGASPLGSIQWVKVSLGAWVLGTLLVSVFVLLRKIHQAESLIDKQRLRYLAGGMTAGILFAGLDFLDRFGLPFPTLGPIVASLYLFFLAQTLLSTRLLDLQELLGKTAAQTVLAAILAAVFVLLTAWVDANFPLFLFNTVIAAFVMLILLEPLRAKVQERVVAVFFPKRFELLQSLRSLRARTANVIDVPALSGMVLDAFNETRRITHASVYLLAEDRPGFRLLDFRGPQPGGFLDWGSARGLLNAAATGQKAVLLENLDRRMVEMRAQGDQPKRLRDELKRINELKTAMQQMKAGISVPLVGNDRVLGFFNLWDERVPEAYASDEIALTLEIAEHLATVIENSKIYEKMRERDRLAALGEMSAGLAHEIRNPLGAIKGAAQMLDPRRLPGEDGELLEVIVEEVNRLNGVVSAFLDYARPLKQNFAPTDINDVVTRTVRLIQHQVPKNIELRLDLAEAVNKVDADAEQLKQVLINLVLNARQAIGDKTGTITVRTLRPERFADVRREENIELHVMDDGPGIPVEQLTNIFVPFFTTKEKGTGLGLAICQRIVKNHGGSISVQSRSGEGSLFIIRLPALVSELPAETPPPEGTPLPAPASLTPAGPSEGAGKPADSPADKKRDKKKRRAG